MRVIRRLLGYVKPYLSQLIAASILLAVSGALMSAVVATIKPLVNRVLLPAVAPDSDLTSQADRGTDILTKIEDWLPVDRITEWAMEHAFVQVPLLIIAIFFIRGLFLYFGQYLTIKSGVSVIRDLRTDLYESVAHQSLGFFQEHSTGTILSRIINDVFRLQRVTTIVLADFVRVGAMMPFLLLTALVHDWRMTLLSLAALPLLGYPMVRLGKRLRRASTAAQENMARVASLVTEAVSGVKVVQGFSMERYEIDRFRGAINDMLNAELRAGRAQALAPAVMELLGAVVGAALFYLAGKHIARGSLDPGNFTVVLFCLGMLFISVRKLNALYTETQTALAGAVRAFDMMDRERQIKELPSSVALPAFEDEIHFSDVSFSYGDERVLDRIELTIRTGEMIALVGPSGSGKSTLANLLPRFYDPTAGRLLIDGHDLREVTLDSLRGQIGLVTQETVLFDDTVRNNIAYGRSDIPQERISEIARASQAHEFIEQMPQGYDTMLGERGARLSMGQRQRITIARALLKDPPILILDEATSALDSESEALVQEALETLMKGRTSLVIAHRLATVRSAHRILVMDQGRIVEHGTHRELLDRGGAYARLYDLQFKESDS
jgi:subfamily B ATP-binding cassette protein MsbA